MLASRDQDTEITLGTGKMLALFFGLVALCALFFAMGFKLGKGSAAPTTVLAESGVSAPGAAGGRPSAARAASSPGPGSASAPDLAFYKSTSQKPGDSPAASNSTTPASDGQPAPADPAMAPATGGYYVQVAAVSRQEDGNALVDALKSKQYAAFSSIGTDKLYHVEVGPFADIKNAEDTRAKLINDGYNPILKK